MKKIVYRENHLYKNDKSSLDDREVGFFPYSRVEIITENEKVRAVELVSADNEEWIELTTQELYNASNKL